jgi:hypothetical protein
MQIGTREALLAVGRWINSLWCHLANEESGNKEDGEERKFHLFVGNIFRDG